MRITKNKTAHTQEVREQDEALKPFIEHHVIFSRMQGNQEVGDCPFCGKPGHFYVNKDNQLWDCKVCGRSGNLNRFLYMAAEIYHQLLFSEKYNKELRVLSNNRKLPISAFENWMVGWDPIKRRYTVPVRTFKGGMSCQDIRFFRPGYKSRSTAGCKTGLTNCQTLLEEDVKQVFICEGEWDGMAMDWLLRKNGVANCCVVAVPGALTFKKEWAVHFQNKDVQTLYDNDAAGEKGELVVRKILKGVARSIKYIKWPMGCPPKFDIRDWVSRGVQVKKPRGCWLNLQKLFSQETRISDPDDMITTVDKADEAAAKFPITEITNEELIKTYRKWLYLPDISVLDIIFGVCFANRLEGDPLWMFMVAPPGGSKSELLMSLARSPETYALTSLTPHTLVSGAYSSDGKDPSLLPRLDGKVLILKDFTTITSMHFTARDEIFGILRDVYDGKTEKEFGTGVKREYKSKFGILAGVTPVIEVFGATHASLGERFIKYRLKNDTKESEEQKILKAISNINGEIEMRAELQAAAAGVLCRKNPAKEDLPFFSPEYLKKVVPLAQMVAWMRGVVQRERYTQQVEYKPYNEVGTRLAKQFVKLAMGIGIYRQVKNLQDFEYNIIKRVAGDTCPERLLLLLRTIYQDDRPLMSTKEIAESSRFPQSSVYRLLEDLNLLKIIDKKGTTTASLWGISKEMRSLLDRSEIFKGED